jgi:predicted nucleotidyltransferase
MKENNPMEPIERAIYATLAYADIFQYPLTEVEIHRYLIDYWATREVIHQTLVNSRFLQGKLFTRDGYYTLSGKQTNLQHRQKRQEVSDRMWPKAIRYGKWIASLPFVRMVAVTGSLAMNNASSDADLDYLVVTRPGRLWLTRAMVVLLVRLASRWGDIVCPNYFITEDYLHFREHNLFTAHEVVQMVPIAGLPVYRQIHQMNAWAQQYLPNANWQYAEIPADNRYRPTVRPVLESILRLPPGGWFEQWEMQRKVRRFGALLPDHPEACFTPNQCKGHLDDHGEHIQQAFAERMSLLEEVLV